MTTETARIRPLLTRPGAGFRCVGNGFCCSDVHLLGGLTRTDRTRLLQSTPDARFERAGEYALRTVKGRCELLGPDGRCTVQEAHGFEAKPTCCRRFPFDLVATPDGGRIVTSHLCPCRALGRHTPISVADAERSLRDAAGRISAGERTQSRIRLFRHTSVSFAAYVRLERAVLDRLMTGEPPLSGIDTLDHPGFGGVAWQQAAQRLCAVEGEDVYDAALRCFGQALSGAPLDQFPRPWARYFRDELFSEIDDTAPLLLGDWLADEVWGLTWASSHSALIFGLDLHARYLGARFIVSERVRLGAAECAAATEAAFLAELVGRSDVWQTFLREAAPTVQRATSMFATTAQRGSDTSHDPGA